MGTGVRPGTGMDPPPPSVILVGEAGALPSAALASLLLAAPPGELTGLLLAGARATQAPDRVRVRPLPLRPATGT